MAQAKSLSKLISVSGHSSSHDIIEGLETTFTVDDAAVETTSRKVALVSPINSYPYAHSHAPLSDGAAVPGSQVAPSTIYRRSVFSTPDQRLSNLEEKPVGMASWSSEVAVLYTVAMTDSVLYGCSSHIQKAALLGEGGGEGLLGLSRYTGGLSSTTSAGISLPLMHTEWYMYYTCSHDTFENIF